MNYNYKAPKQYKHHCSIFKKGRCMKDNEAHDFAVQVLAEEYKEAGVRCIVREKGADNEADLELPSKDNTIYILVVFRADGSHSLDGIDTSWMVNEYRQKGVIPRITFANTDSENGTMPKCGGRYYLNTYTLSLLPDEKNEELPEVLTPVQLAFKYAEAWQNMDSAIIEPYLDKDFHYNSDWVYDELPCRYEYLKYFKHKLNTIKNTHSLVIVKVGRERHTNDCCLSLQQNGNKSLLFIYSKNGRITRAHLTEYLSTFVSFDESDENPIHNGEATNASYDQKIGIGLSSAGISIDKFFHDKSIKYPEYRWIQSDYCYPAFQHLAFAYKGNIYSIIIEFVGKDEILSNEQFVKNQLRECKENDLIACTISLDSETYKPLIDGNHLISTETRQPIVLEERAGNVKMSPWEINNFGVSVVKEDLKKEGKKIVAFTDVLNIEPQIIFEEHNGKKCYVIVKTITGNTPEAAHYQLNKQFLTKMSKLKGYYAEVGIFPRDPFAYDKDGNIVDLNDRGSMTEPKEILFRDHDFYINYKVLQTVEYKAYKDGIVDTPIHDI